VNGKRPSDRVARSRAQAPLSKDREADVLCRNADGTVQQHRRHLQRRRKESAAEAAQEFMLRMYPPEPHAKSRPSSAAAMLTLKPGDRGSASCPLLRVCSKETRPYSAAAGSRGGVSSANTATVLLGMSSSSPPSDEEGASATLLHHGQSQTQISFRLEQEDTESLKKDKMQRPCLKHSKSGTIMSAASGRSQRLGTTSSSIARENAGPLTSARQAWGASTIEKEISDETLSAEPASASKIPHVPPHSFYASVERAHRNTIRREVWRQKFDFLYKQVEQMDSNANEGGTIDVEAREEPTAPTSEREPMSRDNSAACLSSPAAAVAPATSGNSMVTSGISDVKGLGRTVSAGSCSFAASRFEIQDFQPPGGGSRSRVHSAASQQRSRPGSRGCDRGSSAQGACATVRSAGRPGSRQAKRPPSSLKSSEAAACGLETRGLHGARSLPFLSGGQQDLVELLDSYYNGDDLRMHEDILHSSNPRLFPLRGPELARKTFPLAALVAC